MTRSNSKSGKGKRKAAQAASRKKKIMTAVLSVAAVGVLCAGAYMTWLMTPPGLPSTLDEAIAMMKSARYQWLSPERKEQYQIRVRELMEGMNDDERGEFMRTNMRDREVRREMFGGMRAMMEKRTREFARATPEERLAILDEDIDRMVAMREQFKGMRGRGPGGSGGPGAPGNGRDREMSGQERSERRERAVQRGQQNAESGNPQQQALRTEYRAAMDARMKQRGIEPGGPMMGGGRK